MLAQNLFYKHQIPTKVTQYCLKIIVKTSEVLNDFSNNKLFAKRLLFAKRHLISLILENVIIYKQTLASLMS